MTSDDATVDELLQRRLAAAVRPLAAPDWAAVERRAEGPRQRSALPHRALALAAALLLAAAAVAAASSLFGRRGLADIEASRSAPTIAFGARRERIAAASMRMLQGDASLQPISSAQAAALAVAPDGSVVRAWRAPWAEAIVGGPVAFALTDTGRVCTRDPGSGGCLDGFDRSSPAAATAGRVGDQPQYVVGYVPDEVVGVSVVDAEGGEHAAALRANLFAWRAASSDAPSASFLRIRLADGRAVVAVI